MSLINSKIQSKQKTFGNLKPGDTIWISTITPVMLKIIPNVLPHTIEAEEFIVKEIRPIEHNLVMIYYFNKTVGFAQTLSWGVKEELDSTICRYMYNDSHGYMNISINKPLSNEEFIQQVLKLEKYESD